MHIKHLELPRPRVSPLLPSLATSHLALTLLEGDSLPFGPL